MGARGFIYGAEWHCGCYQTFPFHFGRMGVLHNIPLVDVSTMFRPHSATDHVAEVVLNGQEFVIYGYLDRGCPPNKAILNIPNNGTSPADCIYHGEVVIFNRGVHLPFHYAMRIKKAILDEAVLLWASNSFYNIYQDLLKFCKFFLLPSSCEGHGHTATFLHSYKISPNLFHAYLLMITPRLLKNPGKVSGKSDGIREIYAHLLRTTVIVCLSSFISHMPYVHYICQYAMPMWHCAAR